MKPNGRTIAREGDGPLPRVLRLWQVSLAGVGIILGAGIYALLAPAAALAGNAVWASFLIAAAVAVASGLSYAELAAMYPTAGAEYDYTSRALGERVGVAIGWLVVAATIISASAVALGFAAYLRTFLPVPPIAAAVALIVALSLLVALGVRETAGVAVLLTLVEVGGLVAVIVAGACPAPAPLTSSNSLRPAPGVSFRRPRSSSSPSSASSNS